MPEIPLEGVSCRACQGAPRLRIELAADHPQEGSGIGIDGVNFGDRCGRMGRGHACRGRGGGSSSSRDVGGGGNADNGDDSADGASARSYSSE